MQCESGHIFTPDNLNYGYKCDCGDYLIKFITSKSNSFTCKDGHNIDSMNYGYKCPECGKYIVNIQ
jgi:hypothetical protein